MAITLRNKKVEETIRGIGRRTGEGPSAVIKRLAEAEEARLAAEKQRSYEERLARMRAFTATLPPFTDEDRRRFREVEDDLHGEDGLPR